MPKSSMAMDVPAFCNLVSVLIVSLTSCNSTEDEVIELDLAHFFPATHPAETEFVQGWIRAIDEATERKVNITSSPGGTLLQAAATYNGVETGVEETGFKTVSAMKKCRQT